MRIGEVCLLTSDVIRLADFYRAVLGVADVGEEPTNPVHQFILAEETMLTVYNDGTPHGEGVRRVQLAFTVADVDAEHERLLALGVTVIDPPTKRPWGATNMTFLDPDGNRVTFRSLPA